MSKAEQFIKDFTKHCINIIEGYDDAQNPIIDYYPWLTPEQALAAVEIARGEVIDKACEFIDKKANFYRYHYVGEEHECDMVDTRKLVEDLKNSLKGE